ncbi:MAG: hypothetical protein U5K29_11170 [Acidimicrobiales bacterium]|nr:hypothetical protein [Acidimicrobiales bacterium]
MNTPHSTSTTRRRGTRVAAAVTALALLTAACGNDDDTATPDPVGTSPTTEMEEMDETDQTDQTDQTATAGVDTPAADLRAGLTALLQEHVYLAGIAINQAVADGGDLEAPATVAAVETLDTNSVALADAIASVYGDDAGDQFLSLWRDHIAMFVDYTLGGATGDADMQAAALTELEDYASEFGSFIESATGGELPGSAVESELATHVESLTAAIDSVLAGDPDVFANLRTAAGHMPMTALALSGAIATQQGLS